MSKERWGEGNVYLRNKTYWIHFSVGGRSVRESAKTGDAGKARKLLRARLNAIDNGEVLGTNIRKTTVDDLLKLLVSDYETAGKSVDWAKIVQKHLLKVFGYHKAAAIGSAEIRAYIASRRADGVANGTINRELALLRRAFYLGKNHEPPLVSRTPTIPKLEESAARGGFFDETMLGRLCAELPADIAHVAIFAYWTGCRKAEILNMRWPWVDLKHDPPTITLPANFTKSGEGRVIPLVSTLAEMLTAMKAERAEFWPRSPWVFSRAGEQIKNFYAAWKTACEGAGLPDGVRYLHDMRRSAIRNLVRAGVPERVAMAISGHKTRSVFERYNIVSGADLGDAVKRLEKSYSKVAQTAKSGDTIDEADCL